MSTSQLTIRPASIADAEGIAIVQHDCWLDTYPNESLGISDAVIAEHVQNYQSPERLNKWRDIIAGEEYVTVALDGQRVIGFSCAKKADDITHLAAIYVLQNYRGSGAAQKLMDAAMMWLGPDKDILVEVASYNDRAIRFYQKYGFSATGETGHHAILPSIFMRWDHARTGQ